MGKGLFDCAKLVSTQNIDANPNDTMATRRENGMRIDFPAMDMFEE